jgi:hypothetical protein
MTVYYSHVKTVEKKEKSCQFDSNLEKKESGVFEVMEKDKLIIYQKA